MTLERLINGLDKLSNNLKRNTKKELLEKVGEYGVQNARLLIRNIDTGDTIDTIKYKVEGDRLIIEAGGQAIWLEFGTGIAKNPSEYPVEVDGIAGHGEYGDGNGANPEGWWFPSATVKTTGANASMGFQPGAFQLKDGTYLVHTFGIEQNMFMYQTAQEILRLAPKWGLELIGAEIKL